MGSRSAHPAGSIQSAPPKGVSGSLADGNSVLLPRLISFLVVVDGMHSGVSAGGSQHLWVQTEVCGRSVRVTLDFDPASTLDSVDLSGVSRFCRLQRNPKET